ncbi:2-isopropylmalate synthase [bacterium HR23]|nr:2-isopropylmalate synthase [bacterium HR23]
MADRVVIFDTTLRDGEQAAGAGMTVEEKVEIAKQLERLGVDVIEAGFAASSPGDFKAVQTIAQQVRTPIIASLARAIPTMWIKRGRRSRVPPAPASTCSCPPPISTCSICCGRTGKR